MKQKARKGKRQERVYFAQPLEKGIRIIDYLRQREGMWCGVRELAATLHISPATASRILRIFWTAGWVNRSGEGQKVKYAIRAAAFPPKELKAKERIVGGNR